MQDGFDEWGQADVSSTGRAGRIARGGWHWVLTVVSLLIVSLFSFGMAWLTRQVDERPVWMMGLIFMIPTAALMLAVMLVESVTSAMTPSTSRKPQISLAIIATVATFLVACICDLIYLQGFKKELSPASSVITMEKESDRILLVWDPSDSMNKNSTHDQAVRIAGQIMDQLPEGAEIGMVSGNQSVPFALLSQEQRQKMDSLLNAMPSLGRVYYEDALKAGMVMAQGSNVPMRVVFLSDGQHPWSADGVWGLGDLLVDDLISVYWVKFNVVPDEFTGLLDVLDEGAILEPGNALDALTGMVSVRYREEVAPAEVQKDIRLQQDLIRNRDVSAKIITCVMLILEGLSLGICLSLMMSVAGQFRVQYIITPIMGVLAFVLLKYVANTEKMSDWWIWEGLSFSLLGIVIMTKNQFLRNTGRVQAPSFDTFESF